MAELYDQNKIYANRPTASSQAPQSADAELEAMLAELPPEERETARAKITAPPTGEDIYKVMQERNANGEVFNMNLDQYRQYKAYIKTKEVDVLDAMGTAAEGVFNEIMAAAGSIYDKPLESTAKLTPSLIEAFAQGTRNLYGMAAQSQDPNSVFFRVKNAITANGDDEEAEFQQFMDAQAFNVQSMKLATGQETWIVDKDLINPEMTQVMSYIADPTLFVPFGGIAAKGARMIGMGEGLARASARAAQIQRKVLGGAIKWGVGAPIEFLGTATRNTIDYGLERAGAAFEVATGMPAAEARTTAQMYGWYTASAALEGRNVPFPVFGDVAGAMVGSTTARGIGESLTMVGEQMQKQQQFGRGILSYAGQALRDANKSGVPLSKHAKALLNVLDKADPLFVYSADISKGAAEGMAIGAGLGYLSAGEEGAASGAGAGMALGAAGAGMGAVVADVGKGRLYDRIAVQRQMVIEGLRQIDPDKAAAFEAFAKTAELTGNRDLIAQVDGIITGIDVMAPDAKFVARSNADHMAWLLSQRIDPDTGRLMEPLAMFPEFGTNRASRAKALSFLSFVGNRFDGDHKLLIKELQGLPQDHSLRKQFVRLSGEQKKAVFDALDKAATPEFKEIFGGKKAYEFYGDLNYAEANVARVNAMFDAGNKTQANEMIRQFIKNETGKDGKLTARGELLKQKLATEGYFDKDGNMRPSRLKDVETSIERHMDAKGYVFRRDSTGQVEININLTSFGKETAPHELFHAVMLDSVLKPDFIDRLGQNLLGKFDADGKRIENASVDIKQVRQFFQRYIDALHGKNSQEAINETARLEAAMKEYESRGTTNKISLETKDTLEGLLEEFGSYYFGAFINDKPVDFLFRGGELGAMREIMGNAKQGFLDFWRSKIKGMNPDFNFDPATNQFIFQAFEKEGVRTKNKSLDLLMRDFVRATAMANKQGGFDVSRLSPAARETFVKNNGIRGLSMTRDANGNLVRSPQRKVIQEQMRVGKEIFKVLSGLDPKFRQGLITDGEGNLSGRLSPEAMEAMVQSGHIDRAWVDKIQQAYNILDGKGGNVIHFGYLGRTAQIGDYAWPRLVGSDVPFKNRQAVLLGVDFKVGKDGKMYSLFHTLDKAVIDGRADVLWSDSAVRTLWNGDRGAMEADFFRYLANASKAAGDSSRVESAVLLEDGTGAGARRRDVLHQMLGIVKAEGDMYINKPIAEIPYGIRHSVTTFNVDGIANMRVGTDRWNVVPENAFKDLSRNFQPSEMAREDTPNGAIIKHPLGYKFAEKNGKVRAFDKNGNSIGVFDGIEQAAEAAKKYEEKLQVEREQFTEEVRQEQDKKMARFQPIEDATRRQALQPDGDLFSTEEVKAFTQGTRVIKQTQQEFVAQYVQEMLKPENKAKLTELIEQSFDKFRELREIEKQLNAEMEQLTWDSKSNQEELKIIQGKIIELIEERKKNPNSPDNSIIEYFGKNLQRKEELIKRSGEIIAELEAQGITDRSSEYYKTKMAYESYEQGKLSPEVAAVFLESQMQKVYNDQYATGVPVTFVANHGTPNYELIATKMFDVTRLGENTGSASAKRATFFAGSDKTAINYVGVPLEPNWINHPDYAWYFDWDRIKKTIERNYSNADLVIQNTEALFNEVKSRLQHHDTSKGAKNEIEKILAPLEEKSRTGERLNLSTEWLGRLSNHMVDVGTTFGGYEMDWKDAGRPPHLMRQLVKMNNPFVFEYKRADFRDVTFNEVIMKATEAGHDGVIFKNARDGGGADIIYALISNTPNEAIKVFDTAHDGNAVNRGLDENGNKIMNGRELGLMFQPTEGAEGGRVYDQNSNEFKYGFIGKWAEENPERIKGYNLEFIDRGTKYGTHNVRIRLQDNSTVGMTENVGHITADIDPKTKIASLSSNIGVKYRGNKLSYALYSEMAERLRSMGVQKVDGTIVNSDGIPIKVREKIIGNTKILRYDGSSGLPIDYKQGAGIIKRRQAESGNTWGGLDVVNELDPKARYQPTELPKEKGTSEIKKGYTRVYHQTTAENIESIMKQGLLVSKSRPTSESRGVSVSETPFYGNNPNLVTIELQVPTEKLRQANGSALLEDVPASNIIAVHEDWHEKARYIEKNKASLKEVLNGDMDFMLGDGSPEAKAIEYIKNKYSKDKARYQPTEAPLIDAVEMAEARRLGDLFKTKQMREFVGDRKVVPQTADEGFIDFINNFKQADINQQTALYMLDEMAKDMFGGLDRQTKRIRLKELKDKSIAIFEKENPKLKGRYAELPDRHLESHLSLPEFAEYRELENDLSKPAPKEKMHSEFTAGAAMEFAKKIEKAKAWVKKATPQYNDFAGYLADNVPLREYYQHAVYSKKFRTGEPVVVVGVHGTNTSQGFLKDKLYKGKGKQLEAGEVEGAYFASSDETVLSGEYQGYERGVNPPNIAKSAIRFDNPLVVDGQQTSMMKRTEKILGEAIAVGHDGVIYINQMDGGGLDVTFILPVETANKQQRMIGSTREKAMAGDAYEPLPRGEGLTNKTIHLQPTEREVPTRDQGFNRVYREISRSKKASLNSIKQSYLDKWGIDLKDYERFKQLEDAVHALEFRRNNNEYEGTEREYYDELQELKNEYNELEDSMTDQITKAQGDYAHRFNDQEGEITSGIFWIEQITDDISKLPLDTVDTFSGNNRLDALLKRRLGSGFAQEIAGDRVKIAEAFREYASKRYEQTALGEAFESELYSSDYITPQKGRHHYTIPASEGANKKGILVDILRSENKLTDKGLPQGEVNPRRIINSLRNKSGGDSKVYAEAKAIGLIDWLESKQEGKNQKKVTTKELIEFVENNKMGLTIDPQLEQAADFGNTRPYVTGGETQAEKGYRVYVVRMKNANHEHGVEGHFEGAVVHIRATLRDTKDGRKVMHIEEIQANNTATNVLSDTQRKIVKEELGLFEQLKRKREKILDERHDNQMAIKSDSTLTGKEITDMTLQERERARKELDALHSEYAQKIFESNREGWKDIYQHMPQRTDDAYVKLIRSSIDSRGVDIFISERETKLNATKNNAPLQDPKEWVKVAFRTVLRKALVEGVDRITITPWSETPIQVGMKAKSAERFYGKTIADAFNSELAKMNSRLDVENKNVSARQQRITEANIKLNESIQAVAKAVDVNAPNGGADIKKMFEYLHMSDEDLKAKMEKTEHEPYGQPYYGARPAYMKWAEFELQKLPLDYKGRDELYAATQRRANKLGAFIGEELASAGEKTPSGLPYAASEAHMSDSQYLVDRSMGFDMTPEIRKKAARPQRMMQPSEAFSNFQTERTPTGVLLKNAAGYVISRVGSKYRVYNPYKAVIGVFDSEEQAKKRIYKEEPRR